MFDDKQPRQKWLLGKNKRINSSNLSNDGKYREEKVFLGKTRNLIDRPVNRLYIVEKKVSVCFEGG